MSIEQLRIFLLAEIEDLRQLQRMTSDREFLAGQEEEARRILARVERIIDKQKKQT